MSMRISNVWVTKIKKYAYGKHDLPEIDQIHRPSLLVYDVRYLQCEGQHVAPITCSPVKRKHELVLV